MTVDWQQESEQAASSSGVVYYIRTCCRIKIGHTIDLTRRMAELSPDEILATEPGDRELERARHQQFAAYRVRGEWFRDSPALAAHIRGVKMRHHSTGTPGERFVDTAAAMVYTGRQRQILYRWAAEGRITRYGPPKVALWDLFELPVRGPDGKPASPPPRK